MGHFVLRSALNSVRATRLILYRGFKRGSVMLGYRIIQRGRESGEQGRISRQVGRRY